MEKEKYIVFYSADHCGGFFLSNSKDSKTHGEKHLGCGNFINNGLVKVFDNCLGSNAVMSEAHYLHKMGGWYTRAWAK